jgi:DNA-cytosine methyltransferase
MRYGSVCSGIEAATCAWHPLGWEPQFFSEIDKNASSFLARKYPHVPNLGDMTKFQEWPDAAIDLLVGGTPCQSFSVAGLRKGLADPRGNLTLTFLAIAERYKPRYVLWENVPGVLSDKTGALHAFLDGLEELGYIIDIDILDAQFFGLAQRRRRVFVCGEHVTFLLSMRTDSSALTIAQCLIEILHGICAGTLAQSGQGQSALASAALSADGAQRRIRLFGLDKANGWQTLLPHLVEALMRWSHERSGLVLAAGENLTAHMRDAQLMALRADALSTLTAESLRNTLGAISEMVKSFTTSTATNSITPQGIYTCSQAALTISRLITLSTPSHPSYCNAASSASTALQDFTSYARQTTSSLFGDVERFSAWCDFVEQAERTSELIRNTPVECFGKVLPFSESLQGHPPPRREAGKGTARGFETGPHGGGFTDLAPTMDARAKGGPIRNQLGVGVFAPAVGNPLTARMHKGVNTTMNEGQTMVVHALRGEGHDASEDGTGRGTLLIPVVAGTMKAMKESGGWSNSADHAASGYMIPIAFDGKGTHVQIGQDGTTPTLRSMNHDQSHQNGGGQLAVAFRDRTRGDDGRGYDRPPSASIEVAGTLETVKPWNIATSYAVRRLTPLECCRLQGFPDDYFTGLRLNKPFADGPIYKMLGNSMAVPVMRWIGERINQVQKINATCPPAESST